MPFHPKCRLETVGSIGIGRSLLPRRSTSTLLTGTISVLLLFKNAVSFLALVTNRAALEAIKKSLVYSCLVMTRYVFSPFLTMSTNNRKK